MPRWVICSSPINQRSVFLSLVCWMNKSCSGYSPGAVWGLFKVDFLCGEDGIAAQEVDLDLHRIAEPSEDVDVVPSFLVVAAGRIVVDPHLVEHVAVQLGILVRLED